MELEEPVAQPATKRGRGRPQKRAGARLTDATIWVRLSVDQRAKIHAMADELGVSMAVFCRFVVAQFLREGRPLKVGVR
jgi:hypothetical protein